jgi:hypothetical protein
MALITNNISGSSSDSWRIGITGSVRIGNPGARPFPASPGNDVDFFVSGSRGGKGTSGVSVFGGDAVISGSLTIGTGSVTITSNDIQFNAFDTRIESGSNGLMFFDAGNAGGITLSTLVAGAGGGDVDGPGSSTDNAIARFDGLTGKIIQNTAGVTIDDTNNVVTSGSFLTKDGTGTQVASITSGGIISGSSNLLAGGNLVIAGTSALIGVISASGDLAVNGGDLTTTSSTFNLIDETATNVNFARAATTLTVGATTGNTTVRNSLTVTGDLTVNGTTTTVNTTNLLVKDPIIYFGSGSASSNQNGGIALASGSSVTDQALVWGRVANDTWGAGRIDVQNGSVTDITGMTLLPVRASKLEVGGTSSFVTSSDGSVLTLQGQTTTTLSSSAGAVNLDPASGQAINLRFAGSTFGSFTASGVDLRLGAAASKKIILSGSAIQILGAATGIASFVGDGTGYLDIQGSGGNTVTIAPGGPVVSTANIINTNATTVNFAGAATTLAIANSATVAQTLNLGTASTGSSTYNIATGATVNTATKVINIGTGGVGGSTTNITIGSALGLGSTVITGSFAAKGGVTLGNTTSDNISFTGRVNTNLQPSADMTYDLGGPSLRWRNMYTGDLHLRNDRGHWTIIEEADYLTIINNLNGKKYKFVMEEI